MGNNKPMSHPLVQIKGLTKLQLRDTKVTDAGITKFKAARPDCEVTK